MHRLNAVANHIAPSPSSSSCSSSSSSPVTVTVTGAAGQIAYSILPMICRGQMLGESTPIRLRLLDIPPAETALKGVVMEVDDCAFPLVQDVFATTNVEEAFVGTQIAILIGGFPRKAGMARKELLQRNAPIFKEQGAALDRYADKNVKVLVVANPANTNALICMKCAPSIPRENFAAMTFLDHLRAKHQVAAKLGTTSDNVKNSFIWGNHSATQYPDLSLAVVNNFPSPGLSTPALSAINDNQWVVDTFIPTVQQRGAAVIKARKLSSAASAANAAVQHMRNWVLGSQGEIVSMAILSKGWYNIPEGILYSFPVTCQDGKYSVVQGISISDFSQQKMQASAAELEAEKAASLSFLNLE